MLTMRRMLTSLWVYDPNFWGSCKVVKPLAEFHNYSRSLDGKRGQCKVCKSTQSHQDYVSNRFQIRVNAQNRHARGRTIVDAAKNKPCMDCNQSFPLPVMHFHHRDPNTKVTAVAKLVSCNPSRIYAEMEKCDVLCSNCHIIRHLGL
jgi:hypothetical protein